MDKVIKLYLDNKLLKAKFTVEEINGHKFIATQWIPDHCLEEDRDVEEFETYSTALARMHEMALYETLNWSDLVLKTK